MNLSPVRTIAQSAQEYGRGLAGGLIFALPLLYTMEVWEASYLLHPRRLALYILCTYALLLLYNRFAGLRSNSSLLECAIDSVEELGLGLLVATGILWLTGRLEGASSPLEALGAAVLEGMTLAVGISVGTAQLGASNTQDEADSGLDEDGDRKQDQGNPLLSQLSLAFCGAVLFVSNVAPTEEIFLIATESPGYKLFFIALASLLVGSYVLFFSELRGSNRNEVPQGAWALLGGGAVSYAVALVASALTLFFFGRFEGETFFTNFSQTVVAGFAGALGASAGRLLLQAD